MFLNEWLSVNGSERVKVRERTHDPDFIAHVSDKILELWANEGLILFSQFFNKNTVDTYETLIARYSLEQENVLQALTGKKTKCRIDIKNTS